MRAALHTLLAAGLSAAAMGHARADAVTDWNSRADRIVAEAKLGTPPAIRTMAIVQTAVHEAVEAVGAVAAAAGRPAALDAAVAAASRATLAALIPAQRAAVDAAYQAALATLAEGAARNAGIAAGERAAAAVLARRADDGAATPEAYRPHAGAGVYVPTATPAVPHWPQRQPWLMADAAQFRPGPPPALDSQAWARDFNEVKALGSRASTQRSAAQTEVARFWAYSLPAIYHGVVRSVAAMPGREPAANARLFAAVAQAMDDAMIGVFDAKYHYGFWRPVTAIRNGDADGHDGTTRDPAWTPLIDNPMHPEYPSAHAILAAAVGTVLKAEVGAGATPRLATSSPSAKGATRQWADIDDFVREVADARVLAGIHYRFSSEAGIAMGQGIGALAAARFLGLP